MRWTRPAVTAIGLVLTILVAPVREAHAWVEAHVEADDVKVVLERSGDAKVEHRITLRIAGGPLRVLDLKGVDADAIPDPDSYVVPQREASRGSLGSAVQAIAERLPLDSKPRPDGSAAPTVLRVRFDADKGLTRGMYVVSVRYATHLVPRVDAGGPLAHLVWKGPIWDDGFDSARVTFDLPAAPTEPRADDATDPSDPSAPRAPLVLTTVRRGASRDQIELLRPYAPKGEAIAWALRADARALRAPTPATPAPKGARQAFDKAVSGAAKRGALVAGGLALFVLYSVLVAWKAAEVARASRSRGVAPRPLVPLPAPLRAVLAGAALVGGMFIELVLARATAGALLVVTAVALAAHRTPLWPRTTLRRPGRWLPIAEATAFAPPAAPAGSYLDVSTLAGKALLMLLLGGVGAAAASLFETSPYQAELCAFDAAALLAVFCTGRLAELPPDPATAPARLLADVAKRVRKAFPDGRVRILGRVRVADGESAADDLRLAVVPSCATAGFGAIEVGVVYVQGAGAALALPEVILRAKKGTACDVIAERLAARGRSGRGRSASERAILFAPHFPTGRMTSAIVIGLVRAVARERSEAEDGSPILSSARRAA